MHATRTIVLFGLLAIWLSACGTHQKATGAPAASGGNLKTSTPTKQPNVRETQQHARDRLFASCMQGHVEDCYPLLAERYLLDRAGYMDVTLAACKGGKGDLMYCALKLDLLVTYDPNHDEQSDGESIEVACTDYESVECRELKAKKTAYVATLKTAISAPASTRSTGCPESGNLAQCITLANMGRFGDSRRLSTMDREIAEAATMKTLCRRGDNDSCLEVLVNRAEGEFPRDIKERCERGVKSACAKFDTPEWRLLQQRCSDGDDSACSAQDGDSSVETLITWCNAGFPEPCKTLARVGGSTFLAKLCEHNVDVCESYRNSVDESLKPAVSKQVCQWHLSECRLVDPSLASVSVGFDNHWQPSSSPKTECGPVVARIRSLTQRTTTVAADLRSCERMLQPTRACVLTIKNPADWQTCYR